jgi:hypothetical protein
VSAQSSARPGVVIDLDQIQEAQQDWGNTILLHTFHYEMIHGSTCSQVATSRLPQSWGIHNFVLDQDQRWGSGSGVFLTPGSGMGKNRSGMNNPDLTVFREIKNYFSALKYLNSFIRIQDPGWKEFGSGMEKIRIRVGKNSDPGWKKFGSVIRDKDPGSATLIRIHNLR